MYNLPDDVAGMGFGDGTTSNRGLILSCLRNFCLLRSIKFSGNPNLVASSLHNYKAVKCKSKLLFCN